jgi:hypothetical protein
MDAAARAELEALRRRAFGPDADIQDDPEALARLIALEELARPRVAIETAGPRDAVAAAVRHEPASATEGAGVPTDGSSPPALKDDPVPVPRRRRWTQRATLITGTLAAAAIVAAIVLAQPRGEPLPAAAPSPSVDEHHYVFTADPHSETLLRIRSDGAFGGYVELPTDDPPPPFPSTTTLDWAAPLGEYYGWDLWIAGGSGDDEDEHCILIQRGDDTRARCADAKGQEMGILRVSLAGPDIAAEELPVPMAQSDRLRFWWLQGGDIEVVLGSFGDD